MANLKRYAANGGRVAAISQRMAGAQVLVPDNAEGTVALATTALSGRATGDTPC